MFSVGLIYRGRDARIPRTRLPWNKFLWWPLIFVGPKGATYFMSP